MAAENIYPDGFLHKTCFDFSATKNFSRLTNVETGFVEEAIRIKIFSHHLVTDTYFLAQTINWFCGVSHQLESVAGS